MDIQKEREAFEIVFSVPEGVVWCYAKNRYIAKNTSFIFACAAFNSAFEVWQAKAQAVPEKDAIIKKLSDQLYSQEMKTSAARTLCETACELLDDYAHQDAMVILNDLEQAMIEAQEQKR